MKKMEEENNKLVLEHVTEKKMRSSCINKKIILNVVLESPWKPRLPTRRATSSFNNIILNTHQLFSGEQSEEKCDLNSNTKFKRILPTTLLSENQNLTDDSITSAETAKKEKIIRPICNEQVSSNAHPDVHVRRHSSPPRYDCTECGKTFSQLRNFKYHLSVHRGTQEFSATCPVCGNHFNDRGYLSSHMKIHRNRKEYMCSYCPKSFNQRVAYNMHVRIHTGVKPHVCEECGKAFSRKMLLSQHKRTHSGERPYACPFCDKRFADRSNMSLHRRLHTGVKPFCCTLCSKSFTKKHHLKSHLNFHTGDKPYSCPKCNLAFTQSSNMRTHYKKCSA